jgi:hypothetical protein
MEPIGVQEAVAALRAELSASIAASVDEELRFEVGEIEIEFQVAVERVKEGSAGIRFWVAELGGTASKSSTVTHTIRIPLRPVTEDRSPVLTGSTDVPDTGVPDSGG